MKRVLVAILKSTPYLLGVLTFNCFIVILSMIGARDFTLLTSTSVFGLLVGIFAIELVAVAMALVVFTILHGICKITNTLVERLIRKRL